MTAVFVHGVPETSGLWDAVREQLGGKTVALDLPGFGRSRTPDFTSTKDAYVRWLEEELRRIGTPVDLVGHDWGALIVARVATRAQVSLRSWTVDVGSILHPEYEWHPAAQLWQTPDAGEAWLRATLAADPASAEGAAAQLMSVGLSAEHAQELAKSFDETMGLAILDLYRSATPNVFHDWGPQILAAASAPGLVLQPSLDPFDDAAASSDVASRLGARTESLPGLGHWWMLEGPGVAAHVLKRFWAGAQG
ncbi:alpha/beta fold hydrolase [Streptomyces sp. NBC_00568]|uniref:alpha/beta fold hydrolase n=1 Tax=Streptomyces sp. NBC_00568 TaxID=2975779 RepID=UPI002252EA7C|nr:alpha/beta hydrolase [Streptomyces sp. NBC_00568]MCX4993630.1 alpha/beta hydrolase [Streptomyces sp. NBC_00568]